MKALQKNNILLVIKLIYSIPVKIEREQDDDQKKLQSSKQRKDDLLAQEKQLADQK